MKTLVVMPAYEEWENLAELGNKMDEILSSRSDNLRWVVVCEPHSREQVDTRTVAFESTFKAEVIARPLGQESFADAIQIGINSLDEDDEAIIFLDADQSHDPSVIPKLLDVLRSDRSVDVAIASRYTRGGSTDNGRLLRLMSISLNVVYRLVLGIQASDLSTNFKIFRAELLRGARLESTNFEVVEELLMHARERRRIAGKDLQVREIPDRFYVRKHGISKRRLGQFIGTYLISLAITQRRVARSYRNSSLGR